MMLQGTFRSSIAILVALVWLGVLVPRAAAADPAEQDRMYSKFIHHMHDKQYEQAVELAFARAKAGDGWARAQRDDWFARSGNPDDAPPPVVRLVDAGLDKAAKGGDAEAQVALGMRALKSGNVADLSVGVAWLDKAADQGNQVAIYVLASKSRKALASQGITSRHAGRE